MKIFYEPVNLNQWNMFKKVKNIGHVEPFLATKQMNVGDFLLLHVGQQNKIYKSGVYAVGIIIKGPYILKNREDDYCNNKNTVDVEIIRINYSYPYITHDDCKKFIKQFRTVHMIDENQYDKILEYIK